MILTPDNCNELWIRYFATIFNQNKEQNYTNYQIRENLLEDYIDLFRGRNTREKRNWSSLDFEHPFFGKNGKFIEIKFDNYNIYNTNTIKANQLIINHILIADAPPTNINNYTYNIKNQGVNKYITPILKNFGLRKKTNLTSPQRLLSFANKGILILELFPFSFPNNKDNEEVRYELNKNGVTKSFFDDINNPFSILNRINSLKRENIIRKEIDKPNAIFITPPIITHYLEDYIDTNDCKFWFNR